MQTAEHTYSSAMPPHTVHKHNQLLAPLKIMRVQQAIGHKKGVDGALRVGVCCFRLTVTRTQLVISQCLVKAGKQLNRRDCLHIRQLSLQLRSLKQFFNSNCNQTKPKQSKYQPNTTSA